MRPSSPPSVYFFPPLLHPIPFPPSASHLMTGNQSSLSEGHLLGISDTGNAMRGRHAATSSSSSASSSTQFHHNDSPRGASTANRLHSSAQEYSQTVQERHGQILLDKDNHHHSPNGQGASQRQTLTPTSVETLTTHPAVPTPTSSPPTTIPQPVGLQDTLGESPTPESERRIGMQPEQDSEPGGEFSCNICFDTSMSPVLTLCGHLFW